MAGLDLRAGSIALLVGWPAMMVLSAWGGVGAWRSATARAASGGPLLWPLAAKLCIALGAGFTLATTLMNVAPRTPDYARMATGIDPIGHLDAVITPDGRRLRLDGMIGTADATRVEALLQGHPKLTLVELRSPGGRLAEASRIAAVLRARPLQTRAIGRCENACAIVLMAGRSRQLGPAAQLGFQRAPGATFSPLMQRAAERHQRVAYTQAGLTEAFAERVLGTTARVMWRPDAQDLAAAGLIRMPERPFDVDPPLADDAEAAEYIEALQTSAAWRAVEQRFPGTIETAAGRMQAARARGADPAGTQVETQRVLEPLLHGLLVGASAELRIHFFELLALQLDAARGLGADACRNLLAGDTATRAALPAPLAWREAAWLTDAMAEPPRGSQRRASALEAEVVRARARRPGARPARAAASPGSRRWTRRGLRAIRRADCRGARASGRRAAPRRTAGVCRGQRALGTYVGWPPRRGARSIDRPDTGRR